MNPDKIDIYFTNRELKVLRIVLGYAMSNHDDINKAYSDKQEDVLMVDGKQIDLIKVKEVYELLFTTKQKLGYSTYEDLYLDILLSQNREQFSEIKKRW
jgi:hypothetical protein